MADVSGVGDLKALVGPLPGQSHRGEAGKAATVLEARRTALRLAQHQPVKG